MILSTSNLKLNELSPVGLGFLRGADIHCVKVEVSSKGLTRRNFINDARSDRRFCTGVPVTAQRRWAVSDMAALLWIVDCSRI